MRIDRTSMYAYLNSKLSKESLDEVQGHTDWASIEASRDPLQLWIVIKKCHQILTTSKVTVVIKKAAREEYAACKQGQFENIVDFKKRFDARLDALVASGNAPPTDADVAMDFMYGLDNSRYAEFKAEIMNDMQKGTTLNLDDLNKMYVLASRHVAKLQIMNQQLVADVVHVAGEKFLLSISSPLAIVGLPLVILDRPRAWQRFAKAFQYPL